MARFRRARRKRNDRWRAARGAHGRASGTGRSPGATSRTRSTLPPRRIATARAPGGRRRAARSIVRCDISRARDRTSRGGHRNGAAGLGRLVSNSAARRGRIGNPRADCDGSGVRFAPPPPAAERGDLPRNPGASCGEADGVGVRSDARSTAAQRRSNSTGIRCSGRRTRRRPGSMTSRSASRPGETCKTRRATDTR